MADDASFHSCCEELQQHHHCQGSACATTTKAGVGCCYYSSDTDDEAEFLTASNSPADLVEDEESSFGFGFCCEGDSGGGGSGGGVGGVGGGGDLERTLNNGDSHQSPSLTSPTEAATRTSPCDSARPLLVASTVAPAEPPLVRLNASGDGSFNSSGNSVDVDDDDDDFAVGRVGIGGVDCRGKLPPPLASSSRVSLQSLRQSAASGATTTTTTVVAASAAAETSARDSSGDITENAAPDCSQNSAAQYYLENDLTPHRPATRRTKSGPLLQRQPGSADCLLASSCHQERLPLPLPPPPPPASATKATKAATAAVDAVDFPARLRKRVRFADALGFDLTSVVVIAAGCGGGGGSGGGGGGVTYADCDSGGFEFETSMVDSKSELNQARLFAESLSLSQQTAMPQPQPPSPPSQPPDHPSWTSLTPWEPSQPSEQQPVAMETVRFDGPALELSARVLNLAPHKLLTARITFDNWRHQSDWSLRYSGSAQSPLASPGKQPPGVERFRMRLYLPPNATELAVALSYCTAGQHHWDNNAGRNYVYCRRELR